MAYPNYYYPQAQNPYAMQGPVQQAGFIRVPSEEVARNWNVMPGTSATFINENAPYCYTKTVGFSQLDGPKFKKYRLVEEQEEMAQAVQAPVAHDEAHIEDFRNYAKRSDLDELANRVEALERRIGGVSYESANAEQS